MMAARENIINKEKQNTNGNERTETPKKHSYAKNDQIVQYINILRKKI